MKYRGQLISVRGVEVVWLDSQGREGWTDKKEMQEWNEDLLCKSVGYLLREENDRIILVMSESSTSLADGLTIPRACITNLRCLTLAPRRRSERTWRGGAT